MTEREQRVIDAFYKAYLEGDYLPRGIVLAVEDDKRFGWMSDAAKQELYRRIEAHETGGDR